MQQKVFVNIRQLVQVRPIGFDKVAGKDMNELPVINDAFLITRGDRIVDYGKMNDFKSKAYENCIDLAERIVLPSWCDSHTHIVFAENRSLEFRDKIKGKSYEQIAENEGGILSSVNSLRKTNKKSLLKQSLERVKSVQELGTGAIEIKSGYGLNLDNELKMLHVIKEIKSRCNLGIKSTFLGAHAIPKEFGDNKSAYINLIINKMMPIIKSKKLADFTDIFCEKGYFNLKETELILSTAKSLGFKIKIHVNQFNSFGGVKLAIKYNALSVDHLEQITNTDINNIKKSKTMPVLLPGCSFYLGMEYAPARKLIDSGLPVAIATDFNPGSSPSGNMNLVISLACLKMKMSPEESINAATINGAYAMDLAKEFGSITIGKKANLIITKKMNSFDEIPYYFGDNPVYKTVLNGVMSP